jgi:hypothetical protein
VWLFVLLAFIDIRTATINLYIVIPIIYIIHILPFHVLTESKKIIIGDNWQKKVEDFHKALIIPDKFINLQKYLNKYCFFNPLSPQGMLLFGIISSSYRLYFNNKKLKKKY